MNPLTDGKPIEGFPAYRVTPDGNIWSVNTTIAYFAGIVDGEGTIQIIRQSNRLREHRSYVTGAVYVSNSNMDLLSWIVEQFGGHITIARQRLGKNWKPVHRVQFYGESAENIVRMIKPYLICKREQAILYLELRERMRVYKHPLSEEERSTRESIWLACKKANKRGVA